jgi:hypothetical protein
MSTCATELELPMLPALESKLGKGGPRYDRSGRIRSRWVAIRTDVPNAGRPRLPVG